jgi:hypothetical protein
LPKDFSTISANLFQELALLSKIKNFETYQLNHVMPSLFVDAILFKKLRKFLVSIQYRPME